MPLKNAVVEPSAALPPTDGPKAVGLEYIVKVSWNDKLCAGSCGMGNEPLVIARTSPIEPLNAWAPFNVKAAAVPSEPDSLL